jgi:hypothetical protein
VQEMSDNYFEIIKRPESWVGNLQQVEALQSSNAYVNVYESFRDTFPRDFSCL